MRISVIEHDVGYASDARSATVKLDGVAVPDFITADEEAGFVRIGDEIRRGKVEIIRANKQELKPVRFGRRETC